MSNANPFSKVSSYKMWSFLDDVSIILSEEDREFVREIGKTSRDQSENVEVRERMVSLIAKAIDSQNFYKVVA